MLPAAPRPRVTVQAARAPQIPLDALEHRREDRVAAVLVTAQSVQLVAAVYGLLAAGVLDLGAADSGELGILGVAGVVHLLLAAGLWLWLWPRRVLSSATVLLQLALAALYVAIAPERDPSYEVWGLTIRALSAALDVLAILAMVRGAGRTDASTDPVTPG